MSQETLRRTYKALTDISEYSRAFIVDTLQEFVIENPTCVRSIGSEYYKIIKALISNTENYTTRHV